MAQAYKRCPICDTPNHRNATVCTTCGATLAGVKPISADGEANTAAASYNYHYGETDLAEGNLRWKGGTYILAGLLVITALVCVGGLVMAGLSLFNATGRSGATPTAIPTSSSPLTVMTNTPRPTQFLPTVTPAPPTPTITASPTLTPTQGPCVQKVQPNDDLYSIIARCGHRDFNIMLSVVTELNELEDPSRIQIGQEIVVPWPTATTDPNATAAPESTESASAQGEAETASDGQPIRAGGIVPTPTETLLPGVIWHEVQPDENILNIAYQYAANLKVLSELNPEVTFSQCDFGSGSGGPNCTVLLYIGQRIRVPAPTPTPTLSPTPSGSETATPSATPTFNAPSPLTPSDRAFFRSDELITLRWVTSGSLSAEQSYLVRLEDRTAKIAYAATTRELYFIVPEDWHNQDAARHDYIWTVSVVDNNNLDHPYFTTEPRLFTWQGRGESNS